MGKWDERVAGLDSKSSLFSGGTVCWLRLRLGQSSFRGLDDGERLNASLVNKHLFPIDQWGQEAQLIIYEAKKRNLFLTLS